MGVTLLPFAASMSATPGPNNLMVTASAVNFGFRRTLPHMLGVAVGFPIMLVAIGLGFGAVLISHPTLHTVLKCIGIGYLLFLAWKIATAAPSSTPSAATAASSRRPLTFLQAALFQWINPKAWIMAVGAIGTYTVTDVNPCEQAVFMALIFALVAFPCVAFWGASGQALTHVLNSPRVLRFFNLGMAALLVISLISLLF